MDKDIHLYTLKIFSTVSKYNPVLAQPPVKSTPLTKSSFCNKKKTFNCQTSMHQLIFVLLYYYITQI